MSKNIETMVPDVEFVCPFCGGRCAASKKECAVVHTKPTCDKFDKLEPDDFLHACNAVMGFLGN